MRFLKITGRASKSEVAEIQVEEADEILMFFLMKHNLPIASSCAGDGVCKKCALSDGRLSCQMSVEEALSNGPIEFDYL